MIAANSRGSLDNGGGWFIGRSGRSREIGERLDGSGWSLLGLLFGHLQAEIRYSDTVMGW